MTPAASEATASASTSNDNSQIELMGSLHGREIKNHTAIDVIVPQHPRKISKGSIANLVIISMLFAAALIGFIVGFALAGTSGNETTRKQGILLGAVGGLATFVLSAALYAEIIKIRRS
jgi:hypothetical protein